MITTTHKVDDDVTLEVTRGTTIVRVDTYFRGALISTQSGYMTEGWPNK